MHIIKKVVFFPQAAIDRSRPIFAKWNAIQELKRGENVSRQK